MAAPSNREPTSVRRKYIPAVTAGLRKLLWLVLVLAALLGANSIYLATVTATEFVTGQTLQNYFYQLMFLAHVLLGFLITLPFLIFSYFHMRATWRRKNRRAVWMGYGLFWATTIVLTTGFLLTRIGPLEIRSAAMRVVFYWLHVVSPLFVLWFYWLHRLAGPPIKWRVGLGYLVAAVIACALMISFHTSDPRKWYQAGSPEGAKYFEPSLARTANGKFIPSHVLQNDAYCKECHADVHSGWEKSAHRFSSFNNPAYLVSVRETRQFSLDRVGSVRRSRWCAGCHDPVPFFSGQFDDPNFDDVNHPTAHAGITCTVCHSITNINTPRGNADFTIEEPLHYPFAFSDNEFLKWVNRQLVKAKPSFHKKTFLKPFHGEAEFCSTCHKVHLPTELNDYKFLRGQNHHDSFILSGVSGRGARSFYYPKTAHQNCNGCHMPLKPSDDFGAKVFTAGIAPSVHDHLFLGGNTALPHWRNDHATIAAHQEFLRDCVRVDIFAIREGGTIDGKLHAPLRPTLPTLKDNQRYLLDIVIRTLTLGHHFTQGTTDSNEIWLDVTLTRNGEIIGRSGATNDEGEVDPWSHFVNVFMLDKDGNRIDRRNAQDIFVPLYNHQIPPGAAQTVHYAFDARKGIGPIKVDVKLKYRKFDRNYTRIIEQRLTARNAPISGELPITVLASDYLELPVEAEVNESADGESDELANAQASNSQQYAQFASSIPAWMRWNDYGIGMLLKGKAALRQAAEAFEQVEELGRADGPINLARTLFREGRLDEATAAIKRAAGNDRATAPWTIAWLSGLINRQQGYLDRAEQNFRAVLETRTKEMVDRGFDFSKDYEVINLLAQTIYEQARGIRNPNKKSERIRRMKEAVEWFHQTLVLDPENVTAHYNLQLLYVELGDQHASQRHQDFHLRFKADDNARDRAVAEARKKYPAGDHAAEDMVIYDLQRNGQSPTTR